MSTKKIYALTDEQVNNLENEDHAKETWHETGPISSEAINHEVVNVQEEGN